MITCTLPPDTRAPDKGSAPISRKSVTPGKHALGEDVRCRSYIRGHLGVQRGQQAIGVGRHQAQQIDVRPAVLRPGTQDLGLDIILGEKNPWGRPPPGPAG